MTEQTKRSVLITGCSSGIGLCAAHFLTAQGFQVIASARKAEDVADLTAAGLTAVQLDLADEASIEAAVAATLKLTGGRLYGLFNNGAYGQPGALEDLPTAALREQFNTTLFGTHHLTRLVLPVMLAAEEGRIIQNSSILGIIALPFRGAYNASKFAATGLTKAVAQEYAEYNIRVNSVHPGAIQTPGVEADDIKDTVQNYIQNIPMKRIGKPEEVANLVAFLASDKSSYSTGAEFIVDGGIMAT